MAKTSNIEIPETGDPQKDEMLRQVAEDKPSLVKCFLDAYEGKSRKAAIKAFCLECLWLDRKEIRGCTVTGCPLWLFRPYAKRPATTSKKVEKSPVIA